MLIFIVGLCDGEAVYSVGFAFGDEGAAEWGE
jgi:hypothetical protein